MTLHVYNPEHDIALACNQWNFSLPKAAKLTRERFWDVPLRWSLPGDMLLVDNITPKIFRKTTRKAVTPVTLSTLSCMTENELPDRIEPWGWDRYIVHQLVTANKLLQRLCPTDEQIQVIREMSSRKFVAENLLPELVALDDRLVGESRVLELRNLETEELRNCVLKSPWSCSGRGVRFLREKFTDNDRRWMEKIIHEQGYIMHEPLYDKVLDFAMEFYSYEDKVEYRGINFFETQGGRYIRNIEEQEVSLVQEVQSVLKSNIVSLAVKLFKGKYVGPFGIDMMIVEGNKLHPCVELNLRHTMGQGKVKSEK